MSLPLQLICMEGFQASSAPQGVFSQSHDHFNLLLSAEISSEPMRTQSSNIGRREKEGREKSLCLRGRDDEDLKCGPTAVS